jgi:hypothetical protein
MSSAKQKLRLAGAFAALATLALAISCRGFFVNPTLSTITVDPPTPSVETQATLQMTASATYSDGSGGTLSGSTTCTGNTVCWSSSDTTVATITAGGLLTGLTEGTATITAASGAISGSTSATIVLGNVTELTISPSTWTMDEGALEDFTATATLSDGSQVDVSATANWTAANASLVTVENGEDPMELTAGTTAGTTTISATYSTFTATATVTVTGVP